jgi:hypothetical protein
MPPRQPGEIDPFKFGTHRHNGIVFRTNADYSEFKPMGSVGNRPLGLLEPTIVELKGGTIAMFMRAEWGGFLWRAESVNGGATWSNAWQTDIPNPTSQVHMLRLPDGRIALLHNAFGGFIGEPQRLRNRDPLSLWISDDELHSFSVKIDLIKGAALSYPFGMILQDGRFVFVYDRNRRETRFVEVIFE